MVSINSQSNQPIEHIRIVAAPDRPLHAKVSCGGSWNLASSTQTKSYGIEFIDGGIAISPRFSQKACVITVESGPVTVKRATIFSSIFVGDTHNFSAKGWINKRSARTRQWWRGLFLIDCPISFQGLTLLRRRVSNANEKHQKTNRAQ